MVRLDYRQPPLHLQRSARLRCMRRQLPCMVEQQGSPLLLQELPRQNRLRHGPARGAKLAAEPSDRLIVTNLRSSGYLENLFGEFRRQFQQALKAEQERRLQLLGRQESRSEERRKLDRQIETLALKIADYPELNSLTDMLLKLQAKRIEVARLLKIGETYEPSYTEAELRSSLEGSLSDLTNVLLEDPVSARKALHERISGLTLTPVFHEVRPRSS